MAVVDCWNSWTQAVMGIPPVPGGDVTRFPTTATYVESGRDRRKDVSSFSDRPHSPGRLAQ